jgi:hypothetical protein
MYLHVLQVLRESVQQAQFIIISCDEVTSCNSSQ